jgi:hypothetical protein
MTTPPPPADQPGRAARGAPPRPAGREGGEVRPAGRLDRIPGDRYRTPEQGPATPPARPRRTSRTRGLAAAVAVAVAGAILVLVLGVLDLSVGLLAISAGMGWVVAVALRHYGGASIPSARGRALTAALIAGAGILGGLGLLWGWSLTEGGALGPAAYLAERFGVLSVAILVAAPLFAGLRAR